MALAVTAALLLAQVVAFMGIDAAIKWAVGSKDEKLREAALELQKRQSTATKGARRTLASRERRKQKREHEGQLASPKTIGNILAAVAASSNVPGDETESETAEQMSLGSVRAGDRADQHHTMDVGDGDLEGLLAALASLQEKTAMSGMDGVYTRLLGRRNA